MADLAIRRENKGRWERRAPLAPHHVEELVREHGRSVVVQPSPIRIFNDAEYREAGAEVREDLADCRVILGVKEIPPEHIVASPTGRAHLSFFHVIKGQLPNMGQLRRALETRTTMIDYEPIVDRRGRRLLFFGRYAGYAGMIDALWALGRRLLVEGVETPFTAVRQAKDYSHLEEALRHLTSSVGRAIRDDGLPYALHPLVIGFTGGGNVSQGAQEVLTRLPVVEVAPADLPTLVDRPDLSHRTVYKVVFRSGERADFHRHLPYLTVLVNGIYWDPATPRLVTWADLEALWRGHESRAESGRHGAGPSPRLRLIADLSCDVEGSIEATVAQTDPGDPVFVADPFSRATPLGVEGRGPVILAVGNLPAELPRDATEHFGDSLFPFIVPLTEADFSAPFERLELPPALRGAVIAHDGELTPGYRHLRQSLEEVPA